MLQEPTQSDRGWSTRSQRIILARVNPVKELSLTTVKGELHHDSEPVVLLTSRGRSGVDLPRDPYGEGR